MTDTDEHGFTIKHVDKAAPIAAAATALATLVCCFPMGIAAVVATTSLGAIVSAYRGWFLAASAVLLTIGFVQAARAQRACARRNRMSVVILAGSATIVVLVTLFPQLVAGLIADWMP
jgi:hypothetical protein